MRTVVGPSLACVLLVSALSGCLGGDDGVPDHLVAAGSAPLVMTSYRYDGTGITAGTGTVTVDVTESTAEGSVVASVTAGGTQYEVDWRTFAGDPARAFQKQGIAHDFMEHGATGVGDTNHPAMHLVSAGWGPATLRIGGTAVGDPLTGQPTLVAHYMVTDTGVFDDVDRRVKTTDGTGVYSPAAPENGRAVQGDREIHLILRSSPDAAVYADNTTTDAGQLTPQTNQGASQFVLAAAPAKATVTVSVASPQSLPVALGDVNVTLIDPTNTVLRGADLGLQAQRASVEWVLDPATVAGTYVVRFSSQAAVVDWSVTVALDYPEPVFYHFVFEDVQIGSG